MQQFEKTLLRQTRGPELMQAIKLIGDLAKIFGFSNKSSAFRLRPW